MPSAATPSRVMGVLAIALLLATIATLAVPTPAAAVRCPVGQVVLPGTVECVSAPTEPVDPPARETPIPQPEPRPEPVPTRPVEPAPVPTEPPSPAPEPTAVPIPVEPEGPVQEPPEDPVVDPLPPENSDQEDPPENSDQEDPPEPQAIISPLDPVEAATVVVAKSGCSADFDPPSVAVYEVFADACGEPLLGTVFTLTDPNGQDWTMPTGAGPGPTASETGWYNFDPGPIVLTEIVPEGFEEPVVFCAVVVADVPGLVSPHAVVDGAIAADVAPGTTLLCHWFNMLPGPISVTVDKWACPEGIDLDVLDPAIFAAACVDPFDGLDFLVSVDEPAYETMVLVTANGRAAGAVSPPDAFVDVAVTEEVPDGYGAPVVFCSGGALAKDELPDLYDGGIEADAAVVFEDAEPGEHVYCAWYNIPSPDGTAAEAEIVVFTWLCPAGLETGSDDHAPYAAACAQPLEDVTLHLDGGSSGPEYDQTTQVVAAIQKAEALFDGLPAAFYQVSELQPPGESVVFCQSEAINEQDQLSPPVREDITDGDTIEIDLIAGTAVVCDWFTIPPGDGAGGDDPTGEPGDPGDGPDGTPEGRGAPAGGGDPTPYPDDPGDTQSPARGATPAVLALPDTGSGASAPSRELHRPWIVVCLVVLLLGGGCGCRVMAIMHRDMLPPDAPTTTGTPGTSSIQLPVPAMGRGVDHGAPSRAGRPLRPAEVLRTGRHAVMPLRVRPSRPHDARRIATQGGPGVSQARRAQGGWWSGSGTGSR